MKEPHFDQLSSSSHHVLTKKISISPENFNATGSQSIGFQINPLRSSVKRPSRLVSLLKSEQNPNADGKQTTTRLGQMIKDKLQLLDLQKIPPDFSQAHKHLLASHVGPEKEKDKLKEGEFPDYCHCCARQTQRKDIDIFCDIYELSFLGSGYPLYFQFLKQCFIMLALVLVFSGLFNVITNILGSQQCVPSAETVCKNGSAFSVFSLGSKRDQKTFMEIQGYLNLTSLLATIFLLQIFRKLQRELDNKCDTTDISANDYTIMLKNIPKSYDAINDDYDDDLKDYLQKNLIEKKELKVQSVTLCYKLVEINQLMEKKQAMINDKKALIKEYNSLKKQIKQNNLSDQSIKMSQEQHQPLQQLEQKQQKNDQPNASSIPSLPLTLEPTQHLIRDGGQYQEGTLAVLDSTASSESRTSFIQQRLKNQKKKISQIDLALSFVNNSLQSLKQKLMDGKGKSFMEKYFTGIAFVCLQQEQDKEDVIEKYREITYADRLLSEKKLESHKFVYQNAKLKILQAPDPTDVNWNNLHYVGKEKIQRRLLGFLFTVLSLLMCAVTIYIFLLYQKKQIDEIEETNSITVLLISYVLAVLISVLNVLLSIIIRVTSEFCKYQTRTEVNIFIAKGLSIARFINSALISFAIQIFVSDGDKQETLFGGLADNANYFMISNCFVTAISEFLNINYYLILFLRKFESKKGPDSVLTQLELNQLFENPQFPIEERYAQLLMTMFTTAFYCPIVPMTIIWSLIGIILQYWVDKYNLLKRSTVKYNMSASLSIEMTEHLEYFLPIQSISTLIFFYYVSDDGWGISSIIGTGIGLLHAFLPMQLINERLYYVEKAEVNELDYTSASKFFITDYSRENPIYKQQARESHLLKMATVAEIKSQVQIPPIQIEICSPLSPCLTNSPMEQNKNSIPEANLHFLSPSDKVNRRGIFLLNAQTQETFQTNEEDQGHRFSGNDLRVLFKKNNAFNTKQTTIETNLQQIEEEMASDHSPKRSKQIWQPVGEGGERAKMQGDASSSSRGATGTEKKSSFDLISSKISMLKLEQKQLTEEGSDAMMAHLRESLQKCIEDCNDLISSERSGIVTPTLIIN